MPLFPAYSRVKRAFGAGVGLAICKGIVESHGGRLWVADVEVGTAIAVTLPSVAAMPMQEELTAESAKVAGDA